MTPLWSILHPTARVPDGWRAAYEAWMANCDRPEDVEYILSVHCRDAVTLLESPISGPLLTIHTGKYSAVPGWNRAAEVSKGEILIMGADDFFPPKGWDVLLRIAINGRLPPSEYVLHVSTGSERDHGLISHPIMSRPVYKRWGYFVYPAYEGMYADDDVTARAQAEELVIDARHLMFEHRHPGMGKAQEDDVYRWQNRRESYEKGAALFAKRVANGFKDEHDHQLPGKA